MSKVIAMMIVLCSALAELPASRPADHRNRRGADCRRAGCGSSRGDGHRPERPHRVRACRHVGHGRRVPADRAAGRDLRRHGGTSGLCEGRAERDRGQCRPDAGCRVDDGRRGNSRGHNRYRRDAAHRDSLVVDGRGGRHRTDREPAAERTTVRQPRRHGPWRRSRLSLGSDEEHPVFAADCRRQRPQRELPSRRR